MTWELWFIGPGRNVGMFIAHTDAGVLFKKVRKETDEFDTWVFQGGSLSFTEGAWRGSIELHQRKFFIGGNPVPSRKEGYEGGLTGGTLKPKPYSLEAYKMQPYTYKVWNGEIVARLWEPVLLPLDRINGDEFIIKGVRYRPSKGRLYTISEEIPLTSEGYRRKVVL